MAKVLMTGGTGFVGGAIGRQLVAAGHEVTVVTRKSSRWQGRLGFPCKLIEWLPETRFRVSASVLDGIDAVIHLAGEPVADRMWSAEQKRKIYNSRIDSTSGLVASIKAASSRPRVFIQASAVGYYGNRGDTVLTESAQVSGDFLGKTCEDWESAGRQVEKFGVRHVGIRIGLVLGHEGGALPQLISIYSMGLGANLGGGRHYVPWIHLDDLASLFKRALEDDSIGGIYNGTAPEPVPFKEFHHCLGHSLGVPHFLSAPGVALRLLLGGRASIVLNSQRASAEKVVATGFTFRYPDLAAAFDHLFGDIKAPGTRFLKIHQWLPRTIEEIWPFFCDERNLERLTPPYLKFRVEGKSTPEIGNGTLIDYRLVLHGLPLQWRSEIIDWQPGHSFVDRQVKGPYALWHHSHSFDPLAGGTLMTDFVQYKLPFGLIGSLMGGKYVEWDVSRIFRFRLDQGAILFPG